MRQAVMGDADLPISAMNRRRHRRSVTRLVNQERVSRGLPRLRFTVALSLSARAWARALSSGSRFAHGDFARRALRFPFVQAGRGRRREVAENLATGTGPSSTPRAIVDGWMASPRHREVILGAWQYQAVWTQRDSPRPGEQPNSVIVVQHVGRRG
jgi:uncharacterized protein YkwD